ncbi:MAG: hypothetical protein E6Q97_28220 [Desulfurellales bacterium]|nr:MAG: hypothetical protein E6Q97_28220 [Desulfurellales bacterium]
MDERPHKIMTPEEYATLNIKGWHRVCKDVDGFGAVGVIYEPQPMRACPVCGGMGPHAWNCTLNR